jgi:uncharacterized protein (DUF983 family)
MFGDINLKTEVVNGVCPTCAQDTILISITRDFFRCVTCGSDLKQHINGKISYIPSITKPEQIRFETPKNG